MKKIVFSIWLIVATFSVAAICSSCGKKEERGELKRIWYNGSYAGRNRYAKQDI